MLCQSHSKEFLSNIKSEPSLSSLKPFPPVLSCSNSLVAPFSNWKLLQSLPGAFSSPDWTITAQPFLNRCSSLLIFFMTSSGLAPKVHLKFHLYEVSRSWTGQNNSFNMQHTSLYHFESFFTVTVASLETIFGLAREMLMVVFVLDSWLSSN